MGRSENQLDGQDFFIHEQGLNGKHESAQAVHSDHAMHLESQAGPDLESKADTTKKRLIIKTLVEDGWFRYRGEAFLEVCSWNLQKLNGMRLC